MSSALSKCIVQPCRLASIVDWKRGALLALDIQQDRIALAIANPTHAHRGDTHVHRLQSIPYHLHPTTSGTNNTNPNNTLSSKIRRDFDKHQKSSCHHEWKEAQKQDVYNEILNIVQTEDISGFVCAWPLETSGQPGKSCGQIFHLLDYFIDQNEGLLTKSRPLTLWDERQWTHQTYEETTMPHDNWGRSSLFSRAPPSRILNMSIPTVHYPPTPTPTPPSSSSSSSSTSYSIDEEEGHASSWSQSSDVANVVGVDSEDMACLVLENFVSLYFEQEEEERSVYHDRGIDSKRLNQGLMESLVHYDQFGGSGSHFSLAPL